MKWTTEPPKEPGYYWLRVLVATRIVYISKAMYEDSLVYEIGTDSVTRLSNSVLKDAQWAGPIPEPEE